MGSQKPNHENKKLNLLLLKIAESDLKAAKCLHKNGFYPQAIFYLEQAVEKAIKSWGLHRNIIDEGELRKVGHEGTKVVLRVVDLFVEKTISRCRKILKGFPGLKGTKFFGKYWDVDIDELEQKMKNFSNYLGGSETITSENILAISPKELEAIISILRETDKDLRSVEIDEGELEDFKKEYTEFAIRLIDKSEEEIEKVEEYFRNEFDKLLTSKVVKSFLSEIICLLKLMFLSKIACPHATPSRYPNDVSNPLVFYSEDQGLVCKFNQIAMMVNEVLEEMPEIYKSLPPVEFEK